jgi:glyoxylase-like metal-dependent hydrolase (beta-lactamase superfamily II)
LKVTCLSTGAVRPKRAKRGPRRYLRGGWSEQTLPVNVFLLDHPDGLCLFDAGQTVRAADPGYLPRWHPFMRLSRFELGRADQADAQLARIGVDPATVRWVVLSHLHTDHVGGLEDFRHAEVLVSPVEWGRARGVGGRVRGYLPQRWPRGLSPRLIEWSDGPVGPFPRSRRLTRDGRLAVVPIPGHTPGHVGLMVGDAAQAWLCVGDAELEPELLGFCREQRILVLASHDPRARAACEAPRSVIERPAAQPRPVG